MHTSVTPAAPLADPPALAECELLCVLLIGRELELYLVRQIVIET